jgi:hypothetical protein
MSSLSKLVARKILVMFPDQAMRVQVERSLKIDMGVDQQRVDRLRLAILKLSAGHVEKINIAGAIQDPEDTLAWAERPEWMKLAFQNQKLSEKDKNGIDARDWNQYHEWLAEGLK